MADEAIAQLVQSVKIPEIPTVDTVEFRVSLPDGRPVPGASIRLESVPPFRLSSASRLTGTNGALRVRIEKALAGVPEGSLVSTKWEVSIEKADSEGVNWMAKTSISMTVRKGSIVTPSTGVFSLVLRRAQNPMAAHLRLDQPAANLLASARGGALVLGDIDEMLTAVRAALPGATLALAGKSLEGFLRLKGREEGWWRHRFEGKTLGVFLAETEVERVVKRRIGEGYWGRLRGSTVFVRNQGVHFNEAPVTLAEATGSAEIVLHVVNNWRQPATPPSAQGAP